MVGMRPAQGGGHDVYAPRGLTDIADMIVRPNRMPNFHPDRYLEKAARWKAVWRRLRSSLPEWRR